MRFIKPVVALTFFIGISVAHAETVFINVTGTVDFVHPSASGISVGDEIQGAVVYDDDFVWTSDGEAGYFLGPEGFPGSLMLRIGGLIFTEEDDSLFGKEFELFPVLRFWDGELVGMNFATEPLDGAFGISDPDMTFSTADADGASDIFVFGFDKEPFFDGVLEDRRVAGQMIFTETIAEGSAGLQEISELLSTPHGERSSDSDYQGELGPLLNEIIDQLQAAPGEALRPDP